MKKLALFLTALMACGAVSAQAAPIINAQLVGYPTLAQVPFLLEDFGTGGPTNADGKVTGVSSGFLTSTGVLVNFTGASGVYVGDVSGKTRSPIRTGVNVPTNRRYLNARANNGYVELKFGSTQTAFNLLWGSIDPDPASYNQLTFQFLGAGTGEIVTGAMVAAAVAGEIPGTSDVAVFISNLKPFDTIRVTASKEAFEFAPGVPVPEPASMLLLGLGLVGAGARLRRRA